MSSKIPCVSCRYSGPLPKTPQNRPISECTICPPMSGSESTSTTSVLAGVIGVLLLVVVGLAGAFLAA
jgi:hypothetical protein